MRFRVFLLLICALSLRAAAPSPEFVGTATSDGVTRFAFRDPATGISHWLKVGGAFGDYALTAFDTATQTVELTHGSDHLHLKLTAATMPVPPPPPGQQADPVSPSDEYIIKAGDTGKKIARANGVSMDNLIAANPDVNWSKLHPGQKLRLHP